MSGRTLIAFAGKDRTERELRVSGAICKRAADAGKDDRAIALLWASKKFDTLDISRKLHIPEHIVARRIAAIRDGRS